MRHLQVKQEKYTERKPYGGKLQAEDCKATLLSSCYQD